MRMLFRKEYKTIAEDLKVLSYLVKGNNCGSNRENYIREKHEEIVQKETELNARFKNELGSNENHNFIGFLLDGLPTLRDLNKFISKGESQLPVSLTDEQYKKIRYAARRFASSRRRFTNYYNRFFDTHVGDSNFIFSEDFRERYSVFLSDTEAFEEEVEEITGKPVVKDTTSFLDWIPTREEAEQLINS